MVSSSTAASHTGTPGAERRDITATNAAERAAFVASAGEPTYRAEQLERWLFEGGAASFAEMTNLPASFRELLDASFVLPCPRVADEAADADGTVKYLMALHDGLQVEAVFLPDEDHDAVCVSSQVGCRFGCAICATGTLPFRRDLTAYEIFAQYVQIGRRRGAERVRNVVFMGQGEPLANYDAVVGAVELLRTRADVGGRRITVSTSGLADKIRAWAAGGPPVKLAVSLNSAVQETRDRLMPGLARYPLPALAEACAYYARRTRRPITFEYVLVAGVNDDAAHARALVAFTRGWACKINVLPFNAWPGAPYEAPPAERIEAFLAAAAKGPAAVTFRRPRGAGIHAACGTLANRARTVT